MECFFMILLVQVNLFDMHGTIHVGCQIVSNF